MNNAFPQASADCAPPPRTIALVGKYHSPEIAESIRLLAKYLHERGMTVLIEEETAATSSSQLDLRSGRAAVFPGSARMPTWRSSSVATAPCSMRHDSSRVIACRWSASIRGVSAS
jgi:hypothetical protein